MISVPLSSAVLVTRSYLPVNEEIQVSELRAAVSYWSCHASFKWFLLLVHVYKAIVVWKAVRFSSVLISTECSYNLSVSDFTIDILDYLQKVRLRIFPYLLVNCHLAKPKHSHTFLCRKFLKLISQGQKFWLYYLKH